MDLRSSDQPLAQGRTADIYPGGEAEYRRWLPVVAAARLNENIAELESWLLAQAKQCK